MSGLQGRTALVTGAASPRGMGRAIVETLAAQGACVAASDIARPEPDPVMEALGYQYGAKQGLEETVAAARERGAEAEAICADVASPEDVEALVAQTVARFGGVDILVNVAGGSWGSNRVGGYDPEQWLRTVRVNLYGPFLTTRFSLPHMEKAGKGVIINIASVAAIRTHEMLSAYGAAKAGLVQFTRDVAAEYGAQGIRANALLPGDIQTDMFAMEMKGQALMQGVSQGEAAAAEAQAAPVRRVGLPEDVAELAAFLASDAASFLTGLAIPVTGGKELPFRK